MNGRVLVTGATGKTGRRVTERLKSQDIRYRAGSRDGAPPFDWNDRSTWIAALDEVRSIYLLAPPTVTDAAARMVDFCGVALAKGASRFVLHSGAPRLAASQFDEVERFLKSDAREWAILRPTWFMQNFSEGQHLPTNSAEDAIYSATDGGRVPFISVDDIASAASVLLTEPTARNADFILTSDEALSYDDVAEQISAACGRRITHRNISEEALADRLRRRGLPDSFAALLASMDTDIAKGSEDRTTDAILRLTGRAPVTFGAFASESADSWERDP